MKKRYKMNKVKVINLFLIGALLFLQTACGRDEVITLEKVSKEETLISEEAGAVSAIDTPSDSTESFIYVYICGCVVYPGVYEMFPGSRIYEVIESAGGFTTEADIYYVNRAEEVKDGQQIYIPSTLETDRLAAEDDGLIDINRADAEALCEIPGIGETRAVAIVKYREENGDFQSIEDIMKVSGIKQGTFDKMKAYIKVS